MKTKYFFLILTILTSFLFINSISAEEFVFQANQSINFTIPCTIDGFPCSTNARCNATIRDPSNIYLLNDVNMTNEGNGDFSSPITFNLLGTHSYKTSCVEGTQNGTDVGTILITPSGRTFTESQGIGAVGILIGVLLLSFIFLMIGFKLEENIRTMPIGFFFVIFALILGVYSLHLGYSYTADILQYESMISVSSRVYTTILFSLIGLAIISSALMLIAFIKELSNFNKTKKFGVGFNPLTNTYDF